MLKKFACQLALLALLLAALACGSSAPNQPTATPAPTATPELKVELQVTNNTPKPLCYLFVAPADQEFDQEYLNGEQIAPGASFSVPGFKTGKYNVRIHGCDKHMVNALYGANMDQELMTWTIQEATLIVVNKTEAQFCELYVSPSSAPESAWGPNQLENDKFEPQTQYSFFLAKGKWDLRLVPCEKGLDPINEIGLKVEGEYTWEIPAK
jgi:hypothetical protein